MCAFATVLGLTFVKRTPWSRYVVIQLQGARCGRSIFAPTPTLVGKFLFVQDIQSDILCCRILRFLVYATCFAMGTKTALAT